MEGIGERWGGDTHIGTFHGVHDRGGPADPRVTSSDDGLLADHLARGLVVVEAVLALLERSRLGLLLHVRLDTDPTLDLGFDGEVTGAGEGSSGRGLLASGLGLISFVLGNFAAKERKV